jgi:DmsE family decaheme c-type cytochrome
MACAALVGMIAGAPAVFAADAPVAEAKAKKEAPKDIVLKGDAKCTECHDESDSPAQLAIGKTRHGTVADKRTPTCTSCHGDSATHLKEAGRGGKKSPPPDVGFTKKTTNTAGERNDACLSCHRKDSKRSHWEGSKHQAADVTCASCHKMHAAKDPVRDKLTQPEVCFTCHKEQRVQISRPSRHPILEGKVACSDCHNVHGSVGPKLVKRDSTNETCYTCHMEKRGPFVRPHEPVNEDCGICHNPHGTTAENLLKARPPFLCNECHSPHGAALPQLTGQAAPAATVGRNGVNYTQGRGCPNCHTQVHGSNNPTPANPNPQYLLR